MYCPRPTETDLAELRRVHPYDIEDLSPQIKDVISRAMEVRRRFYCLFLV